VPADLLKSEVVAFHSQVHAEQFDASIELRFKSTRRSCVSVSDCRCEGARTGGLASREADHVPLIGNYTRENIRMATISIPVTTDYLQSFADAWNRHDIDALMSFMTEDCVFEASAGAEVSGTRSVGQNAVRAAFAQVWTMFPDAQWRNARHFVYGDRGVSEWIFTGTRSDGMRLEVNGCDLFTFRDGLIAVKNSYRKNRPPIEV
jgi:steroid delta-isomerase-like uncharacterized protein